MAQEAPIISDEQSEQFYRRLRTLAGRDGIDRMADAHTLDALIAPSNRPAWRTDYARGDAPPVSSALSAAVAGFILR